jgi:DNA-directed RNA polymerase subunit RPC12/RpoP
MFYAVCTSCTFLRAYSSEAQGVDKPKRCPACGGRLIVRGKPARFEPTYIGKVAMDLHNAPELRGRDAT